MRILDYRPGTAFWIVGSLALFLGLVVVSQYRSTGSVQVVGMVNRDSGFAEIRERNPGLELVDTFSRTSLIVVRERATGRTAMLDMAVVQGARLEAGSCEGAPRVYAGATEAICWTLQKPDASFVRAVSFTVRARDDQVGHFYRELFGILGKRVSVIQESSRAVILEAEDERRETVARVSVRGSFDTARAFVAVTSGF